MKSRVPETETKQQVQIYFYFTFYSPPRFRRTNRASHCSYIIKQETRLLLSTSSSLSCQRPEHSNPLLFYPPELICLFFICAVWLQKKRKNKLQPSSPLMSVRVFFFNKQCQTFAAESSLNVKICCCSDIQTESLSFRLSFAKKKQSEDDILGSGKLSK